MTPEQNKKIVARFNSDFIEQGNMQFFNEVMDAGFINQTAPPGLPKGSDGVLYFFNTLLKPAFPDLKVVIHDQLAEGEKVTTRKSFQGTHKGEFLGVPPTNKNVVMDLIDIFRLREGKLVEHWGILDMQSVMAQIKA
jgi:predicted ester cyclase